MACYRDSFTSTYFTFHVTWSVGLIPIRTNLYSRSQCLDLSFQENCPPFPKYVIKMNSSCSGCENGNEHSCSVKGKDSIDYMSDCQLLTKDIAPWSWLACRVCRVSARFKPHTSRTQFWLLRTTQRSSAELSCGDRNHQSSRGAPYSPWLIWTRIVLSCGDSLYRNDLMMRWNSHHHFATAWGYEFSKTQCEALANTRCGAPTFDSVVSERAPLQRITLNRTLQTKVCACSRWRKFWVNECRCHYPG
jgi:hypothetical protein